MVRERYSLNPMFTGMDKYFLINKYLMGISMCQKLRTYVRQWPTAPFQVGVDFVSSPLLSIGAYISLSIAHLLNFQLTVL